MEVYIMSIRVLAIMILLTFLTVSTGWAEMTPPVKPTGLSIKADFAAPMIELNWNDNSDNETGFIIERGGSYAQINYVSSDTTTFTDIEIFTDTEYSYRVRAYNEAGESRPSNQVSAVVAGFPDAPSYLEAAAVSSSQINITWEDNSDNETGFRIERKIAGGAYSQIESVAKNITAFADTGLTSNTKYYYRIRAYNTMGVSKYSSETSITTQPPATVVRLIVGNTSYYVDSQQKNMDNAPIIQENRTLLPIKYIAEAMGAAVDWNNIERKVTITLEGTIVELWIGMNKAKVNGVYKPVDSSNAKVSPIIVEPGRTMLPLRFISENLGAKVDWNSAQKEVTVTYPAP
jgi:hypothetical protein